LLRRGRKSLLYTPSINREYDLEHVEKKLQTEECLKKRIKKKKTSKALTDVGNRFGRRAKGGCGWIVIKVG